MTQILLTSFTTWLPHQSSNASDDLLEIVQTRLGHRRETATFHFLRLLPVDFALAPAQTIAHFTQIQPDRLICCGMAESRSKLTVESRAMFEDKILYTAVNLERFIAGLTFTEISHDAGGFVCNRLYYAMLNHLSQQYPNCLCVFVHVPLLTANNQEGIVADFCELLQRMITLELP